MPVDPTSDAEFMKAPPHEQLAYLHDTDAEFAKASPQDQMGYLMHVRGLDSTIAGPAKPQMPDMQKSNLGIALGSENTSSSAIANPQQPAEQFALNNPEQQPKLAAAAGIGAAGTAATAAAPVALPAIRALASKHPIISTMLASEAISQARNIPYVGKFIPPYSEMIPLLMGKGGRFAAEEGAATEGAAAKGAAEEVPSGVAIPAGKTAKPVGPAYSSPRSPVSMERAQSSTMDLHGYHYDSQTMTVQFKNGNVYELRGVPPEIFEQYRNAESQGSFYQQNLKGRYDTRLVGKIGKQSAGDKIRNSLGKR